MSGDRICLYVVCFGLVLVMALMVERIWRGPTAYDRLNALALIGTDTLVLLAFLGLLTNQLDFYVDIAITLALTGFISLVLFARYILERDKDEKDEKAEAGHKLSNSEHPPHGRGKRGGEEA